MFTWKPPGIKAVSVALGDTDQVFYTEENFKLRTPVQVEANNLLAAKGRR